MPHLLLMPWCRWLRHPCLRDEWRQQLPRLLAGRGRRLLCDRWRWQVNLLLDRAELRMCGSGLAIAATAACRMGHAVGAAAIGPPAGLPRTESRRAGQRAQALQQLQCCGALGGVLVQALKHQIAHSLGSKGEHSGISDGATARSVHGGRRNQVSACWPAGCRLLQLQARQHTSQVATPVQQASPAGTLAALLAAAAGRASAAGQSQSPAGVHVRQGISSGWGWSSFAGTDGAHWNAGWLACMRWHRCRLARSPQQPRETGPLQQGGSIRTQMSTPYE